MIVVLERDFNITFNPKQSKLLGRYGCIKSEIENIAVAGYTW